MAFNLDYLQRVPTTSDLDGVSNPTEGETTDTGTTIWTYNAHSTDGNASLAQVQASGFFNGAVGYFKNGDFIFIACNDSSNTYTIKVYVDSATGVTPVTVVAF